MSAEARNEVRAPAGAIPTAVRGEQSRVLVITPSKGWVSLRLRELWEFRELLYFLVWRDVNVRYKQTVLGIAWAVIQPFVTMVVFSTFFGKLARIPSDGLPYPIFVYAGLVPWTFFANSMAQASNSLVNSANLLKKVYFPRLVIPISAVLGVAVDLLVAFGVLIGMMFYYEVPLTTRIVFLPGFFLLAASAALGVSLWLSAWNVQYRDVRHAVPFLVQIWMFSTPVVYPSTLLPEGYRTLYAMNPMVGVVEGFRWALVGAQTAPGPMVLVSALGALFILVTGAFYFRRMERIFADVV